MAAAKETTLSTLPPANFAERYFWHVKVWKALTRDLEKLPHALLLHGPEGLGKRAFGWRLAQLLLCSEPGADAQACGKCASCRLFAAGTHPDLLYIAPVGDSSSIVIDQVREVRRFVALKPHTAARNLVLLEPAEAMNLNAANALLKVLEEPPSDSSLILITPYAVRLPATIRSRCASVPFQVPSTRDSMEWLSARGVDETDGMEILPLAGGAPLRALTLVQTGDLVDRAEWLKDVEGLKAGREDPLRCAVRWKSYGAERCLDWFQRYVADSIRRELSNSMQEKRISLSNLFRYFDVLSETKVLTGGALDETLLLEDILIRWYRLFRPVV